jgi:hypothetical protein
MRRSGTGSGGGIASNKNVRPPVRTGSGSHSTRPAGMAQIGISWGDHSTHRGDSTGYKGERLHTPERNFQPVKFGNEVALNVKGGGPGKGREVMRTGSQGTHGSPAPGNAPPKSGDILSQFGPDYKPRS